MNASNAVATMNVAAQLRPVPDFEITRDQIDLIKRTVMPNASDLELDLFINLCRAKRLDPLTKQIYAIKPQSSGWQFFASIDGLRVIAQRSGDYLGQTAPYWCGMDGVWRDVWLMDGAPAAAKVGVWKRGNNEPTWGVATFRSYGVGKKNNWLSMPDVMLAKCAEALALRKAFPDDLSGLYVREEFTEADAPVESVRTPPQPRIDVVEAQVRGVPMADAIEGEIVDDDTGEITGQQSFSGIPENGEGMIDGQQRGQILHLARKLGWLTENKKDVNMLAVNGFCAEMVGISNVDLLSEQRAAYVIEQMEGQIPGKRAAS
jgi:phage recombination protein Bet